MESDKYKRRIPQTLRRRALISCDRCKKRRVRCLRSPDGAPEDPCQSCISSGVKCESTLPRKHRIYGSVETLSLRYRALDALVKGLFPDESTEDTDTLFRIAEAHHIAMPNPEDKSPAEQALAQPYSPPSPALTQHSPSPPIVAPSPSADAGNPFSSRSTSKILEEKLIPTPHGVSHYIGPSSSFGFALAVRTMVAERHVTQDQHWPDRADFAGLRTSKAIEPRVEKVEAVAPGDPTPRRKPEFLLPAREVADALVEAFFEHVHPNYLLFHRGTFQLRYESIWGHAAHTLEPGWLCSIFLVFAFGAQALEHHDKPQSTLFQRRYTSLAQSRLPLLISTTSLANIQALLLLQLLQHNASERNTAWMLLGCASRMAISLGMHREGATGGFDPVEKQVRRRVWWTLYMFEQNLCMMLGRPSSIDDAHVNVSLPNESLLDGNAYIPPDTLDYSLRLTRVAAHVKRTLYAPSSSDLPKPSAAKALLVELDAWHASLPAHLAPHSASLVPKQRRAVLLLHVHYHHTCALVSRPFLLRSATLKLKPDSHAPLDADGEALAHACGTSARHCVQLLHSLASQGMLDGVAWLDVYYAYHAVLALALPFLVRRDTSQSSAPPVECTARKTAIRDIVDVICSTRLCPTFSILGQVAVQFARIVGIFDVEPLAAEPQAEEPKGEQGVAVREGTDWFRTDELDFSWDFFGVGVDPGVQQVPAYAGTFQSRLVPGEGSASASWVGWEGGYRTEGGYAQGGR